MSVPDDKPGYWWYHDAFCDWAPIEPRPLYECTAGCGTWTEVKDGPCLRCKAGLPPFWADTEPRKPTTAVRDTAVRDTAVRDTEETA
jgi:hypothetical protein